MTKVYWKLRGELPDLLFQITSILNILNKCNIKYNNLIYTNKDLEINNPLANYIIKENNIVNIKTDIDFKNTEERTNIIYYTDDDSISILKNIKNNDIIFDGYFTNYNRFVNEYKVRELLYNENLSKLARLEFNNLDNAVLINVDDNVSSAFIEKIYNKYFKGYKIYSLNDDINIEESFTLVKEDELLEEYIISKFNNIICSPNEKNILGVILNDDFNKKVIIPFSEYNTLIPAYCIKENIIDYKISVYTIYLNGNTTNYNEINNFIDSISKFFNNYSISIHIFSSKKLNFKKINEFKYENIKIENDIIKDIWFDIYIYSLKDKNDFIFFSDIDIKIKKFYQFELDQYKYYVLSKINKEYTLNQQSYIYINNINNINTYDFSLFGALTSNMHKIFLYIQKIYNIDINNNVYTDKDNYLDIIFSSYDNIETIDKYIELY